MQPLNPATSNGPFTIDTTFDDQAARDITNPLYKAPFTGAYRPDDFVSINLNGKVVQALGLAAFNGLSRASANGIWNLEITDYSSLATATVKTQRVLDWGLDLTSNLTGSRDVDDRRGRQRLDPPGAVQRQGDRLHRAAGPLQQLRRPRPSRATCTAVPTPRASRPPPSWRPTTRWARSAPQQGRIYVAYVDAYIVPNIASGTQPGDDTNIYLKYSDDGGVTWKGDPKLGNGVPKLVNDDNGTTDGFSEADISGGVDNGHPQFEPSIAVDASTGTLALSFYDTRYDPQHGRTATVRRHQHRRRLELRPRDVRERARRSPPTASRASR